VRAAITGATGFVGSHLATALRDGGHDVACLVRGPALRGARLGAAGCRVVPGDLHDPAALAALCDGADVVFHVAGLLAARDASALFRANREGAARVASAAGAARVGRLVLVSSLAVSGPSARGVPHAEAGSARPITPYGRSKAAGEDAVRSGSAPFSILRPPAVYGPGDRELLRLFSLCRLGVAPLLGDGAQELSLIHAADLASALIAVAGPAATAGRVYHVAGPEVVTQRELVLSVGRAIGRRVRAEPLPPSVVRLALHVTAALAGLRGKATLLAPDKAPELLAPAWTCSSEALERDAGWKARTSLQEGLAATARWYREQRWL
jgi:nucleoside-diphosphate-sugar epimerase